MKFEITRSKTVHHSIDTREDLAKLSGELLELVPDYEKGIRLLGIGISNFINEEEGRQLILEF
jgi:nucleotidyltransferase/DNA polymerase involved in DNA repair